MRYARTALVAVDLVLVWVVVPAYATHRPWASAVLTLALMTALALHGLAYIANVWTRKAAPPVDDITADYCLKPVLVGILILCAGTSLYWLYSLHVASTNLWAKGTSLQ